MSIKKSFKWIIFLLTIFAVMLMSGCALITEHDKWLVLRAYSKGVEPFLTFKAKIREYYDNFYDDGVCYFDVDYDYFEEQYIKLDSSLAGEYNAFNKRSFGLVPSSLRLLKENGGYELLKAGEEVGNEMLVTTNTYYGWNGFTYPVLGLIIDDITYLDFDTGLENYLNYVRAGFKDPE